MTTQRPWTQKIPLTLLSVLAHIAGTTIFLLVCASILVGTYHATLLAVVHSLAPFFMLVTPALTLALCGGVVFLNHPVHNLLCLITVFFSTVVLYLYVGAEFLAFLFLIVYVGAIAILFLFVIMLLQLKIIPSTQLSFSSPRAKVMAVSAPFAVLGLSDVLTTELSNFFSISDTIVFKTVAKTTAELVWFVNSKVADILVFSDLLYTHHCFLFFMAGILLLTSMLGSIILATSAGEGRHAPSVSLVEQQRPQLAAVEYRWVLTAPVKKANAVLIGMLVAGVVGMGLKPASVAVALFCITPTTLVTNYFGKLYKGRYDLPVKQAGR